MTDLNIFFHPISEAEPSGRFLRREPIYDQIQEARRQDDDAPAGEWERKRKKSDWATVQMLATDALTRHTKDLQIAAWLAEAKVYLGGWQGLAEGLILLRELQQRFWDTIYPPLDEEDGSADFRARPLNWLVPQLEDGVRCIALTGDGRNWLDYFQSREIGYESDATTSDKEERRKQAIKDEKLTAEDFDKSFYKHDWAYYNQKLDAIEFVLLEIEALENFCDQRYGKLSPTFRPLRNTIAEVQQVIEILAAKLRPAEAASVAEPEQEPASESAENAVASEPEPARPTLLPRVITGAAVAVPARAVTATVTSNDSACAAISVAARYLREEHRGSAAPFLLLRGFRWGELRDSLRSGVDLPAPSTPIRQQLKALAASGDWEELLDAAEEAMAAPEGRAWLDLQRYAVTACENLGSDYDVVRSAIRSSVVALITEFPDLPCMELCDGTNVANADTLEWLRELQREHSPEPEVRERDMSTPALSPVQAEESGNIYEVALDAAAAGQRDEAVRILWKAVQDAACGRTRFLRRVQLADLCMRAGVPAIARPVLEQLIAEAESRRLAEWEETAVVSQPLRLLHDCLIRLDIHPERREELMNAICRLDPPGALAIYE